MPVQIYTKTGDAGETSLFDGTRVRKDSLRVECIGTIDELNSWLGLAANYVEDGRAVEVLRQAQRKLFVVGAALATPGARDDTPAPGGGIAEEDVAWLEATIDEYIGKIDNIAAFIVPGTSKAAGFLHVARTVCRRAERRMIMLNDNAEAPGRVLKYINRLSDMIYALARYSEARLEYVNRGDATDTSPKT